MIIKEKQKKFRIGIIGAGIFAEANIYPSLSLHFFDDVERAAVCDLNSERADRLTDKYGWKKTYTDYHKMIEKEYLDAVIIAIGAKAHPKIASDVLRLGLPIFLEKPVSIDIEGALQILDASKETGNIVQVDHQKRHGLAWNKAREIVSNTEEFGNIVQIESKQQGLKLKTVSALKRSFWFVLNLFIVLPPTFLKVAKTKRQYS